MLERDGKTYLSTAEIYGLNRSHEWIRVRVNDGRLQQQRLTPGNRVWYDEERVRSMIDAEMHAKEEKHATEPPPDVTHLLTVAQVAKALGYHRTYINKLIKQKKLSAINIGGESRATDIRVRVEDYEKFVQARAKVGA